MTFDRCQSIEVFKLELLPAWHLLTTLCAAGDTIRCLTISESILPFTGHTLLMESCLTGCGFGLGVGGIPLNCLAEQSVQLDYKTL